jgi:serine/threonine-protein kinase
MLEDTVIEERFLVRERVARQGLTEIWEGLDREEGKTVWIKRWGEPLNQELDFIENWRGQVISLRGIDDGHLPRVLAFGRLPNGDLYQIEEPPRGITLRRYAAARAPMAAPDAVALVATVARAVGTGHREGLAHGGLNPETIWIEEGADGRHDAYIGNWEAGEVIVAFRSAGEPVPERIMRYLSPEQLGELTPPPTFASDVYSLATILYELLTGSMPTAGHEGAGYASRVLADPTPPSRYNPDIFGAVERVILRGLSRDPAERPANAGAFAAALMQALTTPEPVPIVPPPPVVERAEVRVVRPNLWRPVALILALLAFCTVVSTLWALSQRDQAALVAVVTPTPEVRVVPNLVGPPFLNYNDAMRLSWNLGFFTTIAAFTDTLNLPPGVVVQQCPAAGALPETVLTDCAGWNLPPSENAIFVQVSSLPEPQVLRVVPDLYGQPAEAARAALEAGDLRVGTRRDAYDSLQPQGRIVEQNPRRGIAVPPGTPIDIIVSAGPPLTAQDQPGIPPIPGPTQTPQTVIPVVTETPSLLPEVVPTETVPIVITDPSPTSEPEPTEPVVPDQPDQPDEPGLTTLLEDDFEVGNTIGWEEQEDGTVRAVIENGVFAAELVEPGTFWLSRTNRVFEDFTFSADVTIAEGSDDPESGAGLAFRVQDATHFYFFEVNGADSYRLRARNDEEWVTLIDWFPDPSILPLGAVNTLQVRAEADRLTLLINGSQVAVTDIPPEVNYSTGDVGLAAETSAQPLLVQFDNVLVAR